MHFIPLSPVLRHLYTAHASSHPHSQNVIHGSHDPNEKAPLALGSSSAILSRCDSLQWSRWRGTVGRTVAERLTSFFLSGNKRE